MITDRMYMNTKEVLLPFFGVFVIHSLLFGIFIGTIISLVFLPLYVLFRFAAWVVYFHITIDVNNSKIIKRRMILGRESEKEEVTNKLDISRLELVRTERSGMVRHMLTYHGRTDHNLILVRTEADYVALKEALEMLQRD